MLLSTVNGKEIKLGTGVQSELRALGFQANSFDGFLVELANKASSRLEPEAPAPAELPSGARTFGLGGGSVEATKLTEKKVSYNITDSTVEFDFSAIKAALPPDITFLSGRASVVSDTNKRASQVGNAGVIEMPKNPALLNFDISLLTASGQLLLTKTIPVKTGTSGTVTLSVLDQTTAPAALSIGEHLELLSSEVALLKQR